MFRSLLRRCGVSLALVLPHLCPAQVFDTAQTLPRASFILGTSPTVYMDDGTNVLALFVHGAYGLSNGIDLHVRAGFFEATNYAGAHLKWTMRRVSPYVAFSAGAHIVDDPALDATLNLSFPNRRGVEWYTGLDADLVLDDDPDLPVWVFLGLGYEALDRVDLRLEFNYGIFEIAPHILAAGFVFYF